MSLLLISQNRDLSALREALQNEDANLDIEVWPNVKNKERITFAVCWNQPKNVLGSYPNLRVACSYGAGVDHLMKDESLKPEVKIGRVVTDCLKKQMTDYVLQAILNFRNNTAKYAEQKRKGVWNAHASIPKEDCTIGILGMGEMGKAVEHVLLTNGYKVFGWSSPKRKKKGCKCNHAVSEDVDPFLPYVNILVCLLPLTPETEGILNLNLFKRLKKPAFLINVGRGEHLIDEDLLYALDTGALSGACLDVFNEEPLPENHPFWNRPNIMITPHVGAITNPTEAAKHILENYKRSLSGMELVHQASREKGY